MKKILVTFLVLFFSTNIAHGLIEVDITRGNLDPLPIAISPLHVDPQSENFKDVKIKDLGDAVSSVIEKKF